MSDKFQNKYRIASARWADWDYGWDATYFVTICTKNRECFFGEIKDGSMHLSGAGIIANILWYEIKNHAKNVELGEFVVMPNHVHGIVILDGNELNGTNVETRHALSQNPNNTTPTLSQDPNETRHALSQNPNKTTHVNSQDSKETRPALSLQTPGQQRFQQPGKNNLSTIIGSYKSAVTRHANRLQFPMGWQTRFHDHVIRDEQSFNNISTYISTNVECWTNDKFFNK